MHRYCFHTFPIIHKVLLDLSPLSIYFINTYPTVLRVTYRASGAALKILNPMFIVESTPDMDEPSGIDNYFHEESF